MKMNMPLDQVAVFAFVVLLLFGAAELFKYYALKIEELKSELMRARGKNKDLELALNDVVETFSENGINVHRNTLSKINTISRCKAVLGKISRENIEGDSK